MLTQARGMGAAPRAAVMQVVRGQVRHVRRHGHRRQFKAIPLVKFGRATEREKKRQYPPGQFFLHDRLGYRGCIVVPVSVKVKNYHFSSWAGGDDALLSAEGAAVDGDGSDAGGADEEQSSFDGLPPFKVTVSKESMYLALVNQDDITDEQLACNAFWPTVRELKKEHGAEFTGYDFVLHEDVRPFLPSSRPALIGESPVDFNNKLLHEYFQLTTFEQSQQSPDDMGVLASPVGETNALLERVIDQLRDVTLFRSEMEGVRVTIMPFVRDAEEKGGADHGHDPLRVQDDAVAPEKHLWCYALTIENLSSDTIKLTNRQWHTRERGGKTYEEKGSGVLGRAPTLTPEQRVFRMGGFSELHSSSAEAWGRYTFARPGSDEFDVFTPIVHLESPTADVTPGKLPLPDDGHQRRKK